MGQNENAVFRHEEDFVFTIIFTCFLGSDKRLRAPNSNSGVADQKSVGSNPQP